MLNEYRSSFFDKLLLVLAVASIFFEPYLPFYNGSSTAFLLFTFIFLYVGFTKLRAFKRIGRSRYFLTLAGFTLICVLMESVHQYQDYEYILRFVNMSLGIFCISLLCRDIESIRVVLYAFIFCSASHAMYLVAGPFNFLRSITAEGFNEASKARIQAFEQFSIRDHLNDVSIFSGLGAILGIIALFYEEKKWLKYVLLVAVLFSMIGIFLPASRTGALVFFASLIVFVWKSRMNFRRWIMPGLALVVILSVIIPEVVWERIASIAKFSEIRDVDSRAKLYSAIFENIDQYFLLGVGSGNYWKQWAVKAGITNIMDINVPMAPHNAFFQIWIYWGLPAFLAFLYVLYVFSRALDKKISNSREKASLYVFILMIPVVFLFYPRFYHKAFSLGIGMLLGARYWNIFQEEVPAEKPEIHYTGAEA